MLFSTNRNVCSAKHRNFYGMGGNHCTLFIIYYTLFIINYTLSIVHYKLSIIHYLNKSPPMLREFKNTNRSLRNTQNLKQIAVV